MGLTQVVLSSSSGASMRSAEAASMSTLESSGPSSQSMAPMSGARAIELGQLLWEWPWSFFDVASQVWDPLSRKATVTEHYDIFLSHAWGTSSLLKIAALAIRYNMERAPEFFRVSPYRVSFCYFAYDGDVFPSPSRVFFDRCCIPQDDPREKAKCIEAIPEYLACSKRFVSMWDDALESRLWCMFELAVFVKRHGIDKVEIWALRSIEFAAFYFTTSILFWVGHDLLDDYIPALIIDAVFSILNASYVICRYHPVCEGFTKGRYIYQSEEAEMFVIV
ncbi:hypothetical protein FOZ60_012509 [Perkinsus olseni]|uniref:Uncharacterized protein n=1 Tax=Perkinsus olseni TaxID=32597 RepID=A0A7J6P9G2_PEROL|nr:hypothetical protein FOZ60_012509 [Perkinsus olseni]